MTAKEEDILTSQNLIKNGTITKVLINSLNALIKDCVVIIMENEDRDVIIKLIEYAGDYVNEDLWFRVAQIITGFGSSEPNN